jgi:DHA1 family bicyclomycin/chloramphenicol resistance-like MFS transporter
MLRSFWSILETPQFILYTLAGAFSFSGLFAFVAGSPILFMDGFHMTTRAFGLTFAGLVMGFIGGNQCNVFLLRRFSSQQIFAAAIAVQLFFGAAFYLLSLAHLASLAITLALLFVFLSCIGLTYPNSAALGLAPFTREAGRASALLGFLQTGSGAFISMGIGVLGGSSVAPILAATPLIAASLLLAFRNRLRNITESHDPEAVIMH